MYKTKHLVGMHVVVSPITRGGRLDFAAGESLNKSRG